MGTFARAPHVRAPFPHLGNGWTDCTEIWYVIREELDRQLTLTLIRSSPKRRLSGVMSVWLPLPLTSVQYTKWLLTPSQAVRPTRYGVFANSSAVWRTVLSINISVLKRAETLSGRDDASSDSGSSLCLWPCVNQAKQHAFMGQNLTSLELLCNGSVYV